MRLRRSLTIAIPVALIAGSIAILTGPSSPIEVKVVSIQPAGIFDSAGDEMSLMTLSIRNRDSGSLEFQKNNTYQARIAKGWIQLEQVFYLDWMAPNTTTEILLLAPPHTEACRLRFNYQPELFKWRLWRRLGPLGQRAVSKFPPFRRWLMPQGRSMRSPQQWKPFKVEVEANPVRSS
jgi:hypothetical protein